MLCSDQTVLQTHPKNIVRKHFSVMLEKCLLFPCQIWSYVLPTWKTDYLCAFPIWILVLIFSIYTY